MFEELLEESAQKVKIKGSEGIEELKVKYGNEQLLRELVPNVARKEAHR